MASSSCSRDGCHTSHGSAPVGERRVPITRIPSACARRATSLPMLPMPSTPTIRPSRSTLSRGCQRCSRWSASYSRTWRHIVSRCITTEWAIGIADEPADVVSFAPRSTKPRNTGWSTPALNEWNQRTFGASVATRRNEAVRAG